MREARHDPYAPPPPPRERSELLLRFAIVAVLLSAAGWAYMTYSQGPGLTEAANDRAGLADARDSRGYAIPSRASPQAAPQGGTPATTAPGAERLPPPTTATVPPA